jgi:hypothetical protein
VLRKIHDQKASKEDFEKLKLSLSSRRTNSIFEDMQRLYDNSNKEFEKKIEIERT